MPNYIVHKIPAGRDLRAHQGVITAGNRGGRRYVGAGAKRLP